LNEDAVSVSSKYPRKQRGGEPDENTSPQLKQIEEQQRRLQHYGMARE